MKLKLIVSACLYCASFELWALDLLDAYQRAQQNDPNWQANVLQYQADQLNLGIASGNLLPTVTLSGNLSRKNQSVNHSQIEGLPANFGELQGASTTSRQIAVTARQPLFRWDAWQGYKQVKTSVELSEVNLRLQKQQHILQVAEGYFNVLRQQSLTMAYLQEEQALLEQLGIMTAKLKEGLVARSDVSEANAQYQSAQANRISTQVQLVLAQEQLAQLIGPYRENLAVLREDFQFQKPIPESIDAWIDLAQHQNLGILQARLQKRYSEDAKRVEQAALYPQVEAVGTYGYLKQTPETVLSSNGDFDQIGIEVNWNLFSGGRTQKSIRQASVNVQKSASQLEAAMRKAHTEVKQSYLQVETDQAKLKARQAAMESSEMVSRASRAQYEEGLKAMVDILLAQRNAFSAKTDYLNAKYDYVLHVLQLQASVGQLTEKQLAEINAWLVEYP
ncbi:TolC family outer membrane protein [uncultured Acinetobacter sp.]|uniref:multidrug efflux outer membrane protein AbuO n=1 Tax=uncultured Acinetobacter sp. TaxID=165433 RepID=UPI002605B974|nr:TolC family outer membrane protein [uncultured Acinetobacter sp.]